MEYRELKPHPALRRFVRCYWVLIVGGDVEVADAGPVVERVYPDGCAELIFHRGDPFDAATADCFERQPPALLFGQLERRLLLRRAARVETIGVRFHHAGMAPLLGVAASELTGRWEPFESVCGAWAGRLARRVAGADGVREAVGAIDTSLARRAATCAAPDALIESVVGHLVDADGSPSIGDVARAAGVGARQLQRRFADHVGLPPKRLAGILRLQEAFAQLDDGSAARLVDVAYRCGYFDQSHFIRDFRRVTGLPPGRFLRDDGGMARLFVGS